MLKTLIVFASLAANAATLQYLAGPVWDGRMASASLDGGAPISILCIDDQNPMRGLSWSVQVLTLEQAAGHNSRGFDLTTLQLIAKAAAPMFASGVYRFETQIKVWRLGDREHYQEQVPSQYPYSAFRILNPYGIEGQQLFLGLVGDLGDPLDDPADPLAAPEPITMVLVGAGLVWIGRRKRK